MKILRLLLFEDCNRNCDGCCNKDWDIANLPRITDPKQYSEYDMILLTGGEPMLHPHVALSVVGEILDNSRAKIYMYTAKTDNVETIVALLGLMDGITVTLHTQSDVFPFLALSETLRSEFENKSFRLNVFKGIKIPPRIDGWIIKKDIEWIKNCPLPKNEVLYRL